MDRLADSQVIQQLLPAFSNKWKKKMLIEIPFVHFLTLYLNMKCKNGFYFILITFSQCVQSSPSSAPPWAELTLALAGKPTFTHSSMKSLFSITNVSSNQFITQEVTNLRATLCLDKLLLCFIKFFFYRFCLVYLWI